jgi:hypothetical protein
VLSAESAEDCRGLEEKLRVETQTP